MRILFLALDVDMRRQRGETTHVMELVTALSALGHHVLCFVAEPPPKSQSTPHVRFEGLRGSDARIILCVLGAVGTFRPNIVYERRTTPKIGVAIGHLSGLPVVMELNGILGDELARQGRRLSIRLPWLKDAARSVLFREVDRFVVVGNAIGEDLVRNRGISPKRICVIGNGVNIHRFRPRSKRDACLAAGLDPARPRMVFVGNLVPWRDLNTVLESVKIVLSSQPDVELLIVGDGQTRAMLEKTAESLPRGSVLFTGEIPYENIPILISAADLCLLPELKRQLDISPLKLFEYLACSRPVVSFDVPGVSFISSRSLGVVIPGGNPRALADEVLRLFADPAEREAMGLRGREFVEANRSWAVVAQSIESIFSELLEETS